MILHKHIVEKKELKFCLLMAGCFVMLADVYGMRALAMFLKLSLYTLSVPVYLHSEDGSFAKYLEIVF